MQVLHSLAFLPKTCDAFDNHSTLSHVKSYQVLWFLLTGNSLLIRSRIKKKPICKNFPFTLEYDVTNVICLTTYQKLKNIYRLPLDGLNIWFIKISLIYLYNWHSKLIVLLRIYIHVCTTCVVHFSDFNSTLNPSRLYTSLYQTNAN